MESNTYNYGKLISDARKSRKINQAALGDLIGTGKTAISNYETNYITPSLKTLEKIAAALNYTLLELLAFDTEATGTDFQIPRAVQPVNDKHIRFLSSKSMTIEKLISDTYMDSYITLPGFMLATDDRYICFAADDNSMKNHGICKNDYVIVRQTSYIEDNSIVLAVCENTSRHMVRRYFRTGHAITLTTDSDIPQYMPITFDERDSEYKIIGFVEKILKTLK